MSHFAAKDKQYVRLYLLDAALAIRNIDRAIKEAENRKELEVKFSSIKKSLQKGLQPELVAEINDVSVEFVLDIQNQLAQNHN